MKKTLHCNNCKLKNMIDVINKKCVTCMLKQPNFNSPNEKKHYIVRYVNQMIQFVSNQKSVSHVIHNIQVSIIHMKKKHNSALHVN